eukprot:gene575-320_t
MGLTRVVVGWNTTQERIWDNEKKVHSSTPKHPALSEIDRTDRETPDNCSTMIPLRTNHHA